MVLDRVLGITQDRISWVGHFSRRMNENFIFGYSGRKLLNVTVTRPRKTSFPRTRIREAIIGTCLQAMANESNIENERHPESRTSVLLCKPPTGTGSESR